MPSFSRKEGCVPSAWRERRHAVACFCLVVVAHTANVFPCNSSLEKHVCDFCKPHASLPSYGKCSMVEGLYK